MNRHMKNNARKRLIFWGILVAAFLVGALAAPHITPNDPYLVNLAAAKQKPCAQYPFGTDQLGRCLLSRIMAGAPSTLFYSVFVVIITFCAGSLVGVVCGYFGGRIDNIIMRVVDILMAFPGMILCIAIAGILGSGMRNALIALCMTGWTQYARLARSRVLALKEDVFMDAARLTGSSPAKLIFRHVLPNAMRVLIVTAALSVGGTIMEMAGLSFLGLGAQPPLAEWGVLMNEGRGLLQTLPGLVIFPGIFVFVAVMLFNFLGDAIRDVLDPGI